MDRRSSYVRAFSRVGRTLSLAGIVFLSLTGCGSHGPGGRADLVDGNSRAASPVRPLQPRFDDIIRASRIPAQLNYSPAADPGPPPPFIEMADPRAQDCIVRDVSGGVEGTGWRWTYLDPTLKFYLQRVDGQTFVMDFSIVPATFRDTGPVTLSCYINDRLLTTVHCAHPGDYHLVKPVPREWLENANPAIVRAVLDKVWVAPADGARLGYILIRAGFVGADQ